MLEPHREAPGHRLERARARVVTDHKSLSAGIDFAGLRIGERTPRTERRGHFGDRSLEGHEIAHGGESPWVV